MNESLTGKPSIDKPWLRYYPKQLIENLTIPTLTIGEYLKQNRPENNLAAIHYYGNDITWDEFEVFVDKTAKALSAVGFKEGDQIPVFLRSVPEFIYLLLAAEKIGASILCRDNSIEENADAVRKSGASIIFAHDFMSQEELNTYRKAAGVQQVVLVKPLQSGNKNKMPEYCKRHLQSLYPDYPAYGPSTIAWEEFLTQGNAFSGSIDAPKNIDRPLFRAYTSGSTGPSKQVIHSAHTIIGVLQQMNFYNPPVDIRETWLQTILPPSLVAVVVSMVLLPLASNKLLILDPFVDVNDLDLEMMHYRPNYWPLIPMFIETIMKNGRVPDSYDMSHLRMVGAGCEAYNNHQLKRAQKFLDDHNCKARFLTGYGCSEAGSNMALHTDSDIFCNGNVGIPMPLNIISVFKPGTDEELSYNELGEICQCGPGTMIGYDNKHDTDNTIKIHSDGKRWLHTGDIGYMDECGNIFALTRGSAPRFGGGDLATLPMENLLADASIDGIEDEFFVIIPDPNHHRCFVPYLFVVLADGFTIDDIRDKVAQCLEPHMQPIDIIALPERPFFHFKTDRIGLTKDILSGKFSH